VDKVVASVKTKLADLNRGHHEAGACTVIGGMLYMFMDLFERCHSAVSSVRPGDLLN
jgi:hypothetical protein